MDKKEKQKEKDLIEIEKNDIKEFDHKTIHPGEAEFSLQNATYAPGENDYLKEYTGTDGQK